MKKKVKIKGKFADNITWIICGNCGHTLYGKTTYSAEIKWPDPVEVPKREERTN